MNDEIKKKRMPPKDTAPPKKKSIVIPSKHNYTPQDPEDFEGVEETEITAQISLPPEGGWGWVVVTASFLSIFMLDGVYFTFGSIFHDMANDLAVGESLVALTNSVAVAVYFMGGPLASALINRFGFRAISMSGSIVSSMALLCTYFCTSYGAILLLYGLVGGFGACLSSMACGLVVGFYFERLRSLAMAISSVGSSVGIMIMFSVNTQIIKIVGWRTLTLMHSGLLGTIYFYAMTFRPLLFLTVTATATTATETDPIRTVTYLPSLAAIKASPSRTKREGPVPSAAERLFSAVSNAHFPTAAAVVGENVGPTPTPTKAGPSTATASRLTITARGPQDGVSSRHLKQVQSIISKSRINLRPNEENKEKQTEVNLVVAEETPKKKWWQKLCHWEKEVSQARPMYRDDAFYAGRLDKLPAYQKSVMETAPEERTGLEYQMAVSRAVTAAELTEHRGVFTTAVRRILATMLDPKLLKRDSFLLLCTSGFLTYLGYLVPYVFLPDRNQSVGIAAEHCTLFVSVIGFANGFGRLIIGTLAMKYNPVNLYLSVCLVAGFSIIAFNFSFNLVYQYAICVVFGFHIASLSCVRSVVIVHLYGLEMLTNGTGIMIMFQGFGCLISTPISSLLKNMFGYTVSFYVAGMFVVSSGLVLIPVLRLNAKEKMELEGPPSPPTTGKTPPIPMSTDKPTAATTPTAAPRDIKIGSNY